MLTAKDIKKSSEDYEKIVSMQKASFAAKEQLPMWLLRLLAKNDAVHYLVFYADGETDPVGICCFSENTESVYWMYLAVAENFRGQGYSSGIMEYVRSHAAGRPVVFCVESLSGCSGGELAVRQRRIELFRSFGFCETGYFRKALGETYLVMSDREDLPPEQYRRAVSSMYFGLYRPRVCRS